MLFLSSWSTENTLVPSFWSQLRIAVFIHIRTCVQWYTHPPVPVPSIYNIFLCLRVHVPGKITFQLMSWSSSSHRPSTIPTLPICANSRTSPTPCAPFLSTGLLRWQMSFVSTRKPSSSQSHTPTATSPASLWWDPSCSLSVQQACTCPQNSKRSTHRTSGSSHTSQTTRTQRSRFVGTPCAAFNVHVHSYTHNYTRMNILIKPFVTRIFLEVWEHYSLFSVIKICNWVTNRQF